MRLLCQAPTGSAHLCQAASGAQEQRDQRGTIYVERGGRRNDGSRHARLSRDGSEETVEKLLTVFFTAIGTTYAIRRSRISGTGADLADEVIRAGDRRAV